MEGRLRSILKAVSWRIVATLTTIALAFVLTGNLVVSASLGALEVTVKIVVYYLHERLWNLTNFGRAQ
jgi:adenylylsulfate kinase